MPWLCTGERKKIYTYYKHIIYVHILCTFGFEPIFIKVRSIDLATNQILFIYNFVPAVHFVARKIKKFWKKNCFDNYDQRNTWITREKGRQYDTATLRVWTSLFRSLDQIPKLLRIHGYASKINFVYLRNTVYSFEMCDA